jgi:hypothetical protein
MKTSDKNFSIISKNEWDFQIFWPTNISLFSDYLKNL